MSRNQITKAEPLAVSLSREHDTTPVTAGDRLAAWLRGLSPNTARAYTRDLEHFAKHLGETSPGAALDRLCSIPRARAIGLVEAYRQAGVDANLSSATVNRRLAAINSALREIAKADIGPGRLDVKGLKAEPVRETRGPSVSAIARVLEALGARTDARSIRDRAIILLAAQRGLRRAEIAALTATDVDLSTCTLRITRKGKRHKAEVTIGGATCEALRAWLDIRGQHASEGEPALFVALANRYHGRALTGDGVHHIIKSRGLEIGGKAGQWRPHGLRHAAVTECLRRTNGQLAATQQFAGHASPDTTMKYVDNKRKLAADAVDAMSDVF